MPQMNNHGLQLARRLHLQPVLVARESGVEHAVVSFGAMTEAERKEAEQAHEDFKPTQVAQIGLAPGMQNKPFAFAQGVAVIPIQGMLINRFGGSWGGWITGYQYITRMSLLADQDPDVELIVYDVNSGGGEVAGCPECGRVIAGLSKPTIALVDSNCYSAAYWLASACDKIASISTGGAGSIGAMCMHVDLSEALAAEGVKITLMHAGKHKVEGNPFEPLPADLKEKTEAGLEELRQTFAKHVAEGRGISLESVLATEADCYTAQQALDLKLIDAIQTPSEAITLALSRLSEGSDPFLDNEEDDDMTVENTTTGNKPAVTPAAAAPAAAAPDTNAIRAEERNRTRAIMGHAGAASQQALAEHLAYETDMTAEQAGVILDKIKVPEAATTTVAPEATTTTTTTTTQAEQQGANAFTNAMASTPNPEVKPNTSEPQAEVKPVDSILAMLPDDMKSK